MSINVWIFARFFLVSDANVFANDFNTAAAAGAGGGDGTGDGDDGDDILDFEENFNEEFNYYFDEHGIWNVRAKENNNFDSLEVQLIDGEDK